MNADDYIYFEDCAVPDVRKTRIVNVINRSSKAVLGQIKWYGPWRQYCYFPSLHTIYNVDCQNRISAEMAAMTKAHRART